MIPFPSLGADTLARLSVDLESSPDRHGILGGWCAETGFAYLVEHYERTPIAWRFMGPVNREDARRSLELLCMAKRLH